MELILAFVVLAAGAVLALRSATSTTTTAETPPVTGEASPASGEAPPVPKQEPEQEPAAAIATDETGLDTEPWSPDGLLAQHPNGRGAVADPDVTLTAPPVPPVTTGGPSPASPPSPTTVTVRPEVLAITDDRGLDDVLEAATEDAPPPSRPALRLLIAIAGLALAFAAALLLVIRGFQALWRGFFG